MQSVEQLHFRCPTCNEETCTTTFRQHCSLEHNISMDRCPWCFGHCRPNQFKKHAASCFRDFFKSLPSPLDAEAKVLFNLAPMSYSIPPNSTPLPLLDLTHSNLRFQSESLNLAVACMHTFLTSPKSQWLHLKIRNRVWKSFVEAMKDAPVAMLPFSCSCVETNGLIHQHIVLKGDFKKIPRKDIRKENILHPMELVETLDFLSQNDSTCNFSSETLEKRPNHFGITMSLPQLHKIVLALQWDNGILELYHKRYASVDPAVLAPMAKLSSGLWVVPIRELPGFEKQLVLPVSQKFQPTRTPTDSYLHFYQGKKIYFEEIEFCTQEEWVQKQINGGNVLSNLIGNELYYPTPYQQKCLSLIKPQMESVDALEKSCLAKTIHIQGIEDSQRKLKSANLSLKRKLNASERELKHVQGKHIKLLEREISRMGNGVV